MCYNRIVFICSRYFGDRDDAPFFGGDRGEFRVCNTLKAFFCGELVCRHWHAAAAVFCSFCVTFFYAL